MRPQRFDGHWLWVGGPVPSGADGITIGSIIIVRSKTVTSPGFPRLLRHEMVHVGQWGRFGFVGFLVRYVGEYLRLRSRGYGHDGAYRRIPFEIEARVESEREWCTTRRPAI